MVGREDEVHFMLPAGWWTTAGLVLSLVGVVLLFRPSTSKGPGSRSRENNSISLHRQLLPQPLR